MRRFHPATITEKVAETQDSYLLTLRVPDDAADDFRYRQGQHLPVRAQIKGESVRRTYSICTGVKEQRLQLGIRVQEDGVFSNYVAEELQVGDTLEVMPPYGHFNTTLDPEQAKTYAAFVAASSRWPAVHYRLGRAPSTWPKAKKRRTKLGLTGQRFSCQAILPATGSRATASNRRSAPRLRGRWPLAFGAGARV